MTLLRYILSQVFWPSVAAVLALNGLFLVIQLLKVGELTFGAGVGWSDLLRIALLFLPGFALLIIPVAVLTGVLLGFGRMADDGETVALAAAGISAWRMALGPIALGLVASLSTFCVAGFAAPAAARSLHRSFMALAKRHAVASLSPGRFFEDVPRVVMYPRAAGDAPNTFDGFLLYDHRPDRVRHALVANWAQVLPVERGNRLLLRLRDGEVHASDPKRGTYSVVGFSRAEVGLDIDRLVYEHTKFIPEVERLGLEELAAEREGLTPGERKRRLLARQRRFAFPAACFVFSLFGTALGVSGRLRGRRRTLVAAVVIVAAYYFLVRLGDTLVDRAWLGPTLAAWLPNGLMAALVLGWMFHRGRVPG